MSVEFYKLKDLCIDIIDCPHSSPIWRDEGIPVIRNYNLNNGRLDFTNPSFVDEETYKKRVKRAVPEADDIIISREAPMGTVAIVPHGFKCCLGQRLVLLKVNKDLCNPHYLLNVLMSDYVQSQIHRVDKTGSIVSNLNIPDLEKLEIPIIHEQQDEKANFLKNVIEKIENDNKRIDVLEKTLKTIYDYWFVQFDFPDRNGNPYKSSGGKMIYNDILKREIPEGWSVKKLHDIAQIVTESVSPYDSPDTIFDHYSIPAYDELHCPSKERGDSISSDKYFVPDGAILISKLNPQFKRIWIPMDYNERSICSTEFIPFVCNDFGDRGYFYGIIDSLSFQSYLRHCASSSTGSRKRIKPEICADYIFATPDDHTLVERFSLIAKNIFDRENVCLKDRQYFIQLRDFILPLIMNGQVKMDKAV